jgi:hypothetical protein
VLSTLGAHSSLKSDSWLRFLPVTNYDSMTHLLNGILPWETEALLRRADLRIVRQQPHFEGDETGVIDGARLYFGAADESRLIVRQTLASAWQFVAEKPLT